MQNTQNINRVGFERKVRIIGLDGYTYYDVSASEYKEILPKLSSNFKFTSEFYWNAVKENNMSAPRITPDDVDNSISSIHIFSGLEAAKANRVIRSEPVDAESLKLLTMCVIVLKNGFTVTGKSSCVSPENYDRSKGEEIALNNAKDQIYSYLGFELKTKLSNKEV